VCQPATSSNTRAASSSGGGDRSSVSTTFNQPWSVDEQRRLEHLLAKYPPERFESRRFAKIAAELPGRTRQQVSSRVQKYFIKLAKAGLPVPGRTPSLAAHGGRWFSGRLHGHHHHRHNHFYFPPSTFLSSYAPPVYMTNDDSDRDDDDMTPSHAAAAAGDYHGPHRVHGMQRCSVVCVYGHNREPYKMD